MTSKFFDQNSSLSEEYLPGSPDIIKRDIFNNLDAIQLKIIDFNHSKLFNMDDSPKDYKKMQNKKRPQTASSK